MNLQSDSWWWIWSDYDHWWWTWSDSWWPLVMNLIWFLLITGDKSDLIDDDYWWLIWSASGWSIWFQWSRSDLCYSFRVEDFNPIAIGILDECYALHLTWNAGFLSASACMNFYFPILVKESKCDQYHWWSLIMQILSLQRLQTIRKVTFTKTYIGRYGCLNYIYIGNSWA